MAKPTMMMAQPIVESPPGRRTSQTSVATTASVMPPAESRLPFRAVAGLFIMCRPSTNAEAAASQAKKTTVYSVLPGMPQAPLPLSVVLATVGFLRNIWSIRSVTT